MLGTERRELRPCEGLTGPSEQSTNFCQHSPACLHGRLEGRGNTQVTPSLAPTSCAPGTTIYAMPKVLQLSCFCQKHPSYSQESRQSLRVGTNCQSSASSYLAQVIFLLRVRGRTLSSHGNGYSSHVGLEMCFRAKSRST